MKGKMEFDAHGVTITFTERLLGTAPKNPEVYESYIKTKAPKGVDTEDEAETLEETEKQGWSGFHTEDQNPLLFDYQIKGFFKDACGMLRRSKHTFSSKTKAYKKEIDGCIFVAPRKIFIELAGPLEVVERPLRATGKNGERVALARSDAAPMGSKIIFNVLILKDSVALDVIKEWLDYGAYRGIGQWRNSGVGSFKYEIGEAFSF